MPQFHELKEGDTFKHTPEEFFPDVVFVKDHMPNGLVVGANARELESDRTHFIPLNVEVERTVQEKR